MHYYEYHNHKWAKNLSHARQLLEKGDHETFYRGEDLPENDVYPGMKVMAAYWISVEHEMIMRQSMLLKGAGKMEWAEDPDLLSQLTDYSGRFLEDMSELAEEKGIVSSERIQSLNNNRELPDNWIDELKKWQQSSEEALEGGKPIPKEIIEKWFDSCLRSIYNYNHYLIWGGINAARLVKDGGEEVLRAAVDEVAEEFKWEISKEFYVNVMPAVGFEDLGDLMELGMRGMFSDQYYVSGEEQEHGDGGTIKQSKLINCELAGIYWRCAEWNDLPKTSLGYGVCRFCEAHGEATMEVTIPPMYSPGYRRVESLGMDDKTCVFELILTPADDMDRIMEVQAKIFGDLD
jgi:hypothetical protein